MRRRQKWMILPLKWVIVIPLIQDDDCSCFKEISCNVCWSIGIWKGLRIRLLTVTTFRTSIRYFSHAHSLPNRAMQEMLLISERLRLTTILLSRMVFYLWISQELIWIQINLTIIDIVEMTSLRNSKNLIWMNYMRYWIINEIRH